MIIVCPQCETSYAVSPASIGSGRTVKCVRCTNTWLCKLPGDEEMREMVEENALPAAKKAEKQRHAPSKAASALTTYLVLCALLCMGLAATGAALFYHQEIMEQLPQAQRFYAMAHLYPTNHLMLEHAVVEDLTPAGTNNTEVWLQGNIVNHAKVARTLPLLQITLLGKKGQVLASETLHLHKVILQAEGSYAINNKLVYEGKDTTTVELSLGNWLELLLRRHPTRLR
jgi:predicted Zn finger-like uncharacterized protein